MRAFCLYRLSIELFSALCLSPAKSRFPTAEASVFHFQGDLSADASAQSIMASGFTAAQTGRTYDRTRPMLQ
jgi:hypothetical protein